MPVCPGNGLVVLPDLTPAEIARLGPIVASPTYRLLVRDESSFYRAYWLTVELHRPAADAVEFLLPAIWEAKDRDRDDPRRSRTARYQRALIEATDRLGGAMSLDDRAYFWFEAANAYREMGQFGAAERTRQRAVAAIPRLSRAPLKAMIVGLGPAIARHDASDEPLDLIPAVQAAIRCRLRPPADAFGRRYCAEHPAVP